MVDGVDYSEKEVGVWGNDVLDDRFEKGDHGSAIGRFSLVRITCLGLKQSQKSSSRKYRNFRVEFAAPQLKEATPAADQPQY